MMIRIEIRVMNTKFILVYVSGETNIDKIQSIKGKFGKWIKNNYEFYKKISLIKNQLKTQVLRILHSGYSLHTKVILFFK